MLSPSDKYGSMLYDVREDSDDTTEDPSGPLTLSDDSTSDSDDMNRSGYNPATPLRSAHCVLNFSAEDLCSSDPSRLYSPQNSGNGLDLDSSLNRSHDDSSLRHSMKSDLGELDRAIRDLSPDAAQRLMAALVGNDPRELLKRLAKGDSLLGDLRTQLKLETPLHCPWNERFQRLLDLPDTPSKFAALSNLGNDFVHASTMYARVLIDELYLPWESKMIKPCDLGGVHGGVKDSPNDLFSGSDANAAKAAGQELKSLVTIFNVCQADEKLKHVRVPLMCLIDYRGFRVVAISVLPITRATLRYGSSDGGVNVHDDDVRFTVAMKRLGTKLGLKRHVVGNQSLYSPGDIEGHAGLDGRLYLIDLARLFPPEYPDGRFAKNDIWFKLLRCEAVRSFPQPLSSDALSRWGKVGGRENDAEVRQASEWLRKVLVPKCAMALDVVVAGVVIATDAVRVKDLLHQQGVNCRHLGRVRACCVEESARQLLATEIIARTIKCLATLKLREKMREMRLPVDQPYRHLVVNLLNLVLGTRGEDSDRFWTVELRDLVAAKFGRETFNAAEWEPGADLRHTISSVVGLIRRLLQFLGVTLTKKAQSELVRALSIAHDRRGMFRFVDADIAAMNPRVKHATFIDNATGVMLQNHGAVLLSRGDHDNEAMRMFDVADASFRRAIASCATSAQVYMKWAEVSMRLALMWCDRPAGSDGERPARLYFDQLADAVSQAVQLEPRSADEAWGWAGDLKVKAETAIDAARHTLLLYGALLLYQALLEHHPGLADSHNFLFEHGDVCRSAAMVKTGSRFSQRQLAQIAARSWEAVFATDLGRRMEVWEGVNHDDPDARDRLYLASLVMMSEWSTAMFDDLVQVFFQRDTCDLSGCGTVSESSLRELFSQVHHITRVRLNGCVGLSSNFVIYMASEWQFLTEVMLAGTEVDDRAIRFMCKKCLHLAKLDVSNCANVHDACVKFMAPLPNLRECLMRGCDLSDGPLRDVVTVAANYTALQLLDVSLVSRITYTACHLVQTSKPKLVLRHTAKPLFLSSEKRPASVMLSEDGLVCTWTDASAAFMVRANALIPSEMELFYFEIEILEPGHDAVRRADACLRAALTVLQSIGLGLAPRGHSLGGMPGWYSGSYGFHCDDGQKFHGDEIGLGREWGPKCVRGDRVGCAYDLRRRLLFFTRNGKMIGVAFDAVVDDAYYPVVGSFSAGSRIRVHFNSSDMAFDVESERVLCGGDWASLPPMFLEPDEQCGAVDDDDEDSL